MTRTRDRDFRLAERRDGRPRFLERRQSHCYHRFKRGRPRNLRTGRSSAASTRADFGTPLHSQSFPALSADPWNAIAMYKATPVATAVANSIKRGRERERGGCLKDNNRARDHRAFPTRNRIPRPISDGRRSR